jgi:hypothetical protein
MNEYLLVFRNENETAHSGTPEQMQAVMQQWQSWIGGIARSGNFAGTNRLTAIGKTIMPGNVITDGPYMEVKEMIGGYLIVKAASLDQAVEIAKGCPGLQAGSSVEVRQVMAIDGDATSASFLNEKAVMA